MTVKAGALAHSSARRETMNQLINRFLVTVVFLVVPAPFDVPVAQTKQPITHEALWLTPRVGAPSPSPDGKWVVFSLVEPAYDEKEQISDLWIVPSDGSAGARRLTSTKAAESDIAWTTDSRRIAFATKREGDEVNQIYALDLAGGEATRLTSVSTGAASPQWRPDGQAILFTSVVYLGAADEEQNKKAAADEKARKYQVRSYDSFPIRRWDHWLDDRQTHLLVQGVEPGAKPKDLLTGTRLVQRPGFGGTPTNNNDELNAVWAPDGASIVFNATKARNTAAYASVSYHLFQVGASGGEPRQLTSGDVSAWRPQFRPDGRAIYFLTSSDKDQIYSLDRIGMASWPWAGSQTVLTSNFDRSVTSFSITPDSQSIYLTAEDSGLEKLFVLPARGGETTVAVSPSRGVYTGLAIASKAASPVIVANWGSASDFTEVVRIDPAGRQHKLLTDFTTKRAAQLDWQPLRHFTFTSSRGKAIHNMLALPAGFDQNKKYPLLVVIHGGAANMFRDQISLRWNYHLLAQPGYVILLTNYTGSTGFGEKFSREIHKDPLAGPASEINEAADEAIRRFPFIAGTRQAAAGASYGGHLVNWLQATTTRYRCLISHAGLINSEAQWGTSDGIYHRELMNGGPPWEQGSVWREQNPIRRAAHFKTPILLSVGERDFRVPINNTLEFWSALQRMRVPSLLLVWPNANHWISSGEDSRHFYREVHAWLAKWLDPLSPVSVSSR
jgi:dipeptidyl aminopeptidase/acylaminoacyl peptidase